MDARRKGNAKRYLSGKFFFDRYSINRMTDPKTNGNAKMVGKKL